MIYSQYKTASIRHLHTCNELIATLPSIKNASTERNILLNLYYLAGYTIECIVNYAIYDYLKFNPLHSVNSLSPTNSCGVGYLHPMRYPKNIRSFQKYVITSHKFQHNCQFRLFFQSLLVGLRLELNYVGSKN